MSNRIIQPIPKPPWMEAEETKQHKEEKTKNHGQCRSQYEVKVVEGWPIPADGYLADYLSWAGPRTEAPTAFHLANALVACGAILGRKCAIEVGQQTYHPNFYVVAVGDSTLYRKTTSVKMQRTILDRASKLLKQSDQLGPQLLSGFYLADDGTPEGLLRELKDQSHGIKVFAEFGDFLKKIKKRDFLGSFSGLLTELYDCPDTYRKQLSNTSFTIDQPFLSIIGTTTYVWFVEAMDESDLQSGFLARFLYFRADEDIELIPITEAPDDNAEQNLARQLVEFQKIQGTFWPDDGAKETYSDWYRNHRKELEAAGTELLAPYWGRLEGYVWKIAFLFDAVGKQATLTSISEEATQLAIRFVERLKEDLRPLILTDFQPSRWAKKVQKILRFVEKAPPAGIRRSLLLKNSHVPARDLDQVVEYLLGTEEIVYGTSSTGARIYKLREEQEDE